MSQLKRVAKTIVYFERCLDSLMPAERRYNVWCQSNRCNAVLKSQSMVTVFSWIDAATSPWHLAFLLCAFSKDSDYAKAVGKTQDFPHYVFRWNFTPLAESNKGTIEFRQPPGCTGLKDTFLWIMFALGFVQGGNLYADTLDATRPPTMDQLKSLVLNGAQQSDVSDLGELFQIFDGKTLLPNGAFDLKNDTQGTLSAMLAKANQTNISIAKFKSLYGFK